MSLTAWNRLCHNIGYRVSQLGCRLAAVQGDYPITKPIDPANVEVLGDRLFQRSVSEVANLTLLDTARLANLWSLCQRTDPQGNLLEIGAYKGGGALHLSNCCPKRKIIVCDSFSGFEALNAKLDRSFEDHMFKDTNRDKVAALFKARGRSYEVIEGFFPASCKAHNLAPVSFVHLDVDVFKATIESLLYLEREHILMDKTLIVLDDYDRNADGVNQAVAEFTTAYKKWLAFPLFPGQCLLLSRNWFSEPSAP
jgi:hypothetical protein